MTRMDLIDNPDLLEFGLMAAADPTLAARMFGHAGPPMTSREFQDRLFPESR